MNQSTPATDALRTEWLARGELALRMFSKPMRQILLKRNILTVEEALDFLSFSAPEEDDPNLLTDMQIAVDRILLSLAEGETITVYGDYDADGVTATTLMVETLVGLGALRVDEPESEPHIPPPSQETPVARVRAYIPDRFDEGYGLNREALSELKADGVGLVISVDCGIRSLDEAAHAKDLGLDLIITDHHSVGPSIPEAVAVINPKRAGDRYPSKSLAGVGVAYKLAVALVRRMGSDFDPAGLLDLVAVGTVADMVPLLGENRYLVKKGLERINTRPRLGLHALMGAAGVQGKQVTASTIGFSLGPRINAAGRLASALDAYNLLITNDHMRAGSLAQEIEIQNSERQKITRAVQEKSEEIALKGGEMPFLLHARHEDFNPGVVGLAASRLTEAYYRPSIVGHREHSTTRASCRSIPEFDITAALDQCADLLLRYGGHAAAAGFTVENDLWDTLIGQLSDLATGTLSGSGDLAPVIEYDAKLTLAELTVDLLNELDLLQPTGTDNPDPVFFTKGMQVKSFRTVGRDNSHLKLILSDGDRKIDAIAFRQGHWNENMPERIDAVYHFEKNEYMGKVTPQLNIRDLRPAQ